MLNVIIGSSPLTLGALRHLVHNLLLSRLIPARAGNTGRADAVSEDPRAHPRSRGEHWPFAPLRRCASGSSPLARGAQNLFRRLLSGLRLIPACAGNATSPQRRHVQRRAHPRSRGEHFYSTSHLLLASGSSPLARGTPAAICRIMLRFRLIPARAGNTRGNLPDHVEVSAHPRSRGEHSYTDVKNLAGTGSSPLARGTPT